MPKPLLAAIVGPTGSGKSSLALAVADLLDGEIVNCDSVQIFRGFDVGTAKTPLEHRRGIPHHLLDFVDATDTFTAGDYVRAAREVLAQITERKKLPVVAGGTGFYLRALLHGLFEGPERNETLRWDLYSRENRKSGALHRLLTRFDPPSASRIHPNDVQKLVRALEVTVLSRQPLSRLHDAGRDRLEGYRIQIIGLNPPREQLYARLNERSKRMFEAGLVDEVRGLLQRGVPASAKPFESIGYSQALRVLNGDLSIQDAIEETQIATRHYAKRQLTWFRKEEKVFWINDFGETPRTIDESIRKIKTTS